MSISTFQDKFIKGGCGPAVLIFCAAVMFGGMFYSCAQGNLQHGQVSQANQEPGITVSGTTLPAFYVQSSIEGQMRQILPMLAQSPEMSTPQKEAEFYGRAVDQLVNEAAYVALAQKNGVDLSDAGLRKIAAQALDDQLAEERARAVTAKQLKENATEKEWEDFFQKQYKQSIADIKKARMEGVDKQLADPSLRQAVVVQFAQPGLMQALKAKLSMTDEDVRRANESVTYKRIVFKSEIPGKPAGERAEAALKAIQEGLKFETAIDRYSNELPGMNKKLSDATLSVTGSQALTDSQYAPLSSLKVGEVSGVVDVPEGKAIYKVVSRTGAPADFEKKKDTYRKTAETARVQAEIDKQLKAIKADAAAVRVNMASYSLAYRFFQLSGGGMGVIIDPVKAKALYEDAVKVVQKGTDTNLRLAALVQYGALMFTQSDPSLKPEEFRKKQIETIRAVLDSGSNFNLRMQLVDLLIEEKDNEAASQELLNARRDITTFDNEAQQQGYQISAKRAMMKGKNILTADAEKKILEEQERWQKDKVEADKIAAEQKKEEEARRKAEEAEAKKKAEEAKKAAPNVPTTGTTPGTTTATTPTTGTTGLTGATAGPSPTTTGK